MLSFLIYGSKQPGNDLDVYLTHLIKDLETVWDVDVDIYDAYRKDTFNLQVVFIWTISEFPAYENLSGYTVISYYTLWDRQLCKSGIMKMLE